MKERHGNELFERAHEVLGLFRKGAEFTQELLEENRRLRGRLNEVLSRQDEAAQDVGECSKLREELLERIRGLECEKQDVLEQLRAVEDENRQFASRYLEIEEENNNLANLYVASYQLHSTLELAEVVKIIIEIVINLVGAEVFAVYVLDEKSGVLQAVAAEGAELSAFPTILRERGIVGESVESGETFCGESSGSGDLQAPIVCIPLRVEERAIGAIAIYRLLSQKDGFSPLDHELFTLLAGHAATAICAAQLHAQSKRKLNTIQGFIDLLTK